MSDLEKEFRAALAEADDETVTFWVLYSLAVHRGEQGLADAVLSAAMLPRLDGDETCDLDFDLLGRIKTVCPDDESLTWGRALTRCVMRGDQRKAAALQDLMRRRVAS